MHIKMKKYLFLFFLLFSLQNIIYSQSTWENNNAPVYPYLSRMAQKGFIEFNDIIKPQTRISIQTALIELKEKQSFLTVTEIQELDYFLKEYKNDYSVNTFTKPSFLKKDENNRWRSIHLNSKDLLLNIDPIFGIQNISYGKKSIKQVSNGFQMWGSIGNNKNWGYQVYYRDFTETGDVINYDRINNNDNGVIILGDNNKNLRNYSEIRANISYSFKKGLISVGKDHITWGYGENGKLILSDKSPSFPFIRLDYSPIKWLNFNYFNAWLNSNIIDSNLTYNTNTNGVMGDIRYFYKSKYLASHSILINPIKGLTFALGESIIYSDRMDIGFLLPINMFKIYDNNRSNYLINAGSNGQYFLQVSSRNHIKNTHLYGSLFIDEIKVSAVLDKKEKRNQLGYTIGGSTTDLFVNYLNIGVEYTRINPFVYSNLIPAQFYTNYDYQLGDWMGNNFDRYLIFAKYTPYPRLNIYSRYQSIRKGGAGTIYQQYLVQPLPEFLFDYKKNVKSYLFRISYEFLNQIYLLSSFEKTIEINSKSKISTNRFQLGISLGLK